jgi:CBS domain containing-hemolysin-like protein
MSDRDYLVGAHIELARLCDATGLELPEGDYHTLAGFLISIAREIPAPGTVVSYRDISFHIERGTRQAAQEIRIRW